jgi:PAP2 superfamily C-terminal
MSESSGGESEVTTTSRGEESDIEFQSDYSSSSSAAPSASYVAPPQEVVTSGFRTKDDMKAHFLLEWSLFKTRWKLIVFAVLYQSLVLGVFARNLATYLHGIKESDDGVLWDAGFAIIPALDFVGPLSDMTMWFIVAPGLALMVVPLFWRADWPAHFPAAFCVNLGTRVLLILALGHTMRASFYLSTSLPGPISHCRRDDPDFVGEIKDASEVFTNGLFESNPGTCGDLIFSGHVFQSVVFALHVRHHALSVLGPRSKRLALWVTRLLWVIFLAEVFFILSERAHYSVDILVGAYVGVSLWFLALLRYPLDPEPMSDETVRLP